MHIYIFFLTLIYAWKKISKNTGYIYIYICGGLLFRKYYKNCINWAYDPTAQSEDGQIKVIMEKV